MMIKEREVLEEIAVALQEIDLVKLAAIHNLISKEDPVEFEDIKSDEICRLEVKVE